MEVPSVGYRFRQSGVDVDQNDSHGQAARSGYRPNCQPSLVRQGRIWTKMPTMGDRQQGVVMGCVVSHFRQSGFDIHRPSSSHGQAAMGGYGPYCQAFLDHDADL